MRNDYSKQDLIRMVHNLRMTIADGMKEDASEEDVARMHLFLNGSGDELNQFLEGLVEDEQGSMMKKDAFDRIIRNNVVRKTGKDCFGYIVSDTSKKYDTYYSNQVFDAFIAEMKSSIYKKAFCAYDCGKGGELQEHTGRYGKMPPKMSSVASSSRFCFLALKDGAEALGGFGEVAFEHECRIKGISGTAPQLDAFVPNENIYIEVKCHEIFDPHRIVMKKKYWSLIYGTDNKFGLNPSSEVCGDTFEIPLSVFGITKKEFDV